VGIAVVLILYFIVLSISATICGVILVVATRWYLRTIRVGRGRVTTFAALLPFACVVYAGVWFIAYAVINDVVFHHDPMLGDGWYTDIGNGYAIDMIDVTDQGNVHPTDGPDRGLNNPDGVSGVRRMQVAGAYIYGTQDKGWFENLGRDKKDENMFFAIETSAHAKKEFSSEAELATYAKQKGVILSLRPFVEVYQEYRKSWFEVVAGIVLLAVPAFGLWWLVRWVFRLKREVLDLSQAEG
jgi:hypothetical protein